MKLAELKVSPRLELRVSSEFGSSEVGSVWLEDFSAGIFCGCEKGSGWLATNLSIPLSFSPFPLICTASLFRTITFPQPSSIPLNCESASGPAVIEMNIEKSGGFSSLGPASSGGVCLIRCCWLVVKLFSDQLETFMVLGQMSVKLRFWRSHYRLRNNINFSNEFVSYPMALRNKISILAWSSS